jgi:integrase
LQLGKGRHLGFRNNKSGVPTWIAKYRDGKVGRLTNPLGDVTDVFDFDEAKKVAEEWFFGLSLGIRIDPKFTVRQAAAAYIEDRLRAKGAECAADIKSRFKDWLYTDTIVNEYVTDVMSNHLVLFRDRMKGRKRTRNRKMQLVRATLRCAVRIGKTPSHKQEEWAKARPYKDEELEPPKKPRVYLTMEQRALLIDKCVPTVAIMLKAAAWTGARPGEIARAKVKQYDKRIGEMTFVGKTGARTVRLSPGAQVIFDIAARDKLPEAWLFPNTVGRKWAANSWGQHVTRATRAALLPDGTCMYSMRHSFITDYLVEGLWSIFELAKYCGTSAEMIEKHYGHLKADIAAKLERVQMLRAENLPAHTRIEQPIANRSSVSWVLQEMRRVR